MVFIAFYVSSFKFKVLYKVSDTKSPHCVDKRMTSKRDVLCRTSRDVISLECEQR